jgi:AGZA family xanthine/uracil permease-like MFS transporter
VGVLYHGLEVLGGGSILTGLVLGAIGVFVIEKKFVKLQPSLPRRRPVYSSF